MISQGEFSNEINTGLLTDVLHISEDRLSSKSETSSTGKSDSSGNSESDSSGQYEIKPFGKSAKNSPNINLRIEEEGDYCEIEEIDSDPEEGNQTTSNRNQTESNWSQNEGNPTEENHLILTLIENGNSSQLQLQSVKAPENQNVSANSG